MLEKFAAGLGLHICSFLDQQLDVIEAPPLYGNVQGCLTCWVFIQTFSYF